MKNILTFNVFLSIVLFCLSAKAQYSTDLCNGGTASASSAYSGTYAASAAFDNILTYQNCWASSAAPSTGSPQWLKYDFGASTLQIIQKYTIAARYYTSDQTRCPKDWTFEASNDNTNWTLLDTRANETGWNTNSLPTTKREYTFTNNTAYRYYRIVITANNGGTSYVAIGEMEMMGPVTYTNYLSKRSNVWYFGNYAGLDFNTDPITVLTNSAMLTREGCSSICDTLGNLQFYTDGYRAWNKNHVLMENGDSLAYYNPTSLPHSTQAGVIVPHPGNPDQYYVFTTPCMWTTPAASRFFSYSLIDMSYNGGLGKVIQKNVRIYSYKASERITAVGHYNRHDIWVINHEDNSNNFRAYLISNTGLDTVNPVLTSIGASSAGDCNMGCLKASPDGKKLAMAFWCNASGSHFELYDFNNATGVISNLNDLGYPTGLSYSNAYGVEFSPDGSRLYGSTLMAKKLFQWNMLAGTNLDIKNSRTEIGTTTNYCGTIQLAPNGKIYCAMAQDGNTGYHTIGVINNPNSLGTASNYSNSGIRVDVNYTSGNLSRQGFPNYIQSYLYVPPFEYNPACFGQNTCFTISNTTNISSVLWNFGDAASGLADTSTSMTPCHTFTAPGNYSVKLYINFSTGSSDSTTQVVTIYDMQPLNLTDYTVCTGTQVTIDAGAGYTSYIWSTGETTQSITVTANVDTSYIVTVTNANGCSATDTSDIIIGGSISVSLNDVTFCNGDDITLDAGIPNAIYLWAPGGQTTQTISVSAAGTYYVTVTSGGCSGSDSSVVTVHPPPSVTIFPDDVTTFCLGDSVTLHSNNVSGTFSWYLNGNNTGITDSTIIVFTSGNYSLLLTDNNNCYSFSNTITVSVSPPPAAIIPSNVNPICQGDSVLLYVQSFSGGSYQWFNNNAIIAGATDTTFYATQSGNYTVAVTSSLGCSDTSGIVAVTILPQPTAPIHIIGNDSLCSGAFTTIIHTEFSSGNTYQWLLNNIPIPNETDTLLNPQTTGSYSVVVTNAAGCEETSNQLSITVLPTPSSPTISSNSPVCIGDTIYLTSSTISGATYIWTGPSGYTSSDQNPFIINSNTSHSGTYELTVTLNGCESNPVSTTVSVLNPPLVSISNDTVVCSGNTVTLQAGGGSTYLWNTAQTTASIQITPNSASTYTVTVSNGSCFDTAQVYVGTISVPNAFAGNDTSICYGESIALIAYGGTTYLWNTSQTTQSISVTPGTTTNYSVTVSNGQCSASDIVTVTVVPLPSANAGNDTTICNGNNIVLTATGGTAYLWNTAQTSASISVFPTTTTTYSVTVSNGSCIATDDITVTVQNPPVITTSNDTSVCLGSAVQLWVNGGTTYEWNNAQTNATITVSPTISTIYSVTATTGICSSTEQIAVTVNPLPVANAGNNQTICNGNQTTLNASGGTSYFWNTGATTSSITVNPSSTTTYTVTVSNDFCSSTDDVTIIVENYPVVSVTNDTTICPSQSLSLTASGGGSYLWSNGSSTASITINPTATTVYSVTVSNGNCGVTETIIVSVISLPTVNAGADFVVCEGEDASINAIVTGGYNSALWSSSGSGNFSNASQLANFYSPSSSDASLGSVILTISLTTACGNVNDDLILTISKPPAISSVDDKTICRGSDLVISGATATGASTIFWATDGSGQFTNPGIINTTYISSSADIADGLIWLTVTATNLCGSIIDSVKLQFHPIPEINAGTDVEIEAGISTQLSATGGISYIWSPDEELSCNNCPNPIASPLNSTTYTVVGTDNNGCSSEDTVFVKVLFTDIVFVPNGFSPNNDGKNDVLYVRGSGIKNMTFQVFDRWGEKVFESNSTKSGWDGSFNGTPLDPGVFAYYLKVDFYNGSTKTAQGNITLFR